MKTSPVKCSVQLLLDLSREMREGRGEDAKSDELRDALDAPLYELTEEERSLVEQLSEDLYMLENQRFVVPLSPGESLEDVLKNAAQAFQNNNNRKTLELLRKIPSNTDGYWPDDILAYGFGRCWERIGFAEAAVDFYDFAFSCNPKNNYAIMALEGLVRSGCLRDALTRVETIERDPSASSPLLMKAAAVVFQWSANLNPEDKSDAYQRVIQLVQRGEHDESILGSLRANAFLVAGFSYENLGQPDDAMEYFNRAVKSYTSDAPLVARGIAFIKRQKQEQALADFREAVRRRTSLIWPYFYLTHDALIHDRWQEARDLAQTGASHTHPGPQRARFFEWEAIAAANLGWDSTQVISLFERAIAEDPFDHEIRTNSESYVLAIAAHEPPSLNLTEYVQASEATPEIQTMLSAA